MNTLKIAKYMGYSEVLEKRLGVNGIIDKLEEDFDDFYNNTGSLQPRKLLENIRVYLNRRNNYRIGVCNGSQLDSTDCLTWTVLGNLIANRKDLETEIAYPTNPLRYCHVMLTYPNEGSTEVFIVSGRNRKYQYKKLTVDQVIRRLKYIRPIVNFVNRLRRIKEAPDRQW